jgi:serine/threonine protein kinase
VRIDYVAVETERSDRFLLSTDGVHGGLNNLTLLKHLGRRASPQEAADAIVEAALDARIGDNATALVLDILDVPAMDYSAFAARFTAGMSDLPQKPGMTVDGFHLDELLSDGRYTRVFRATDEVEARQVVMKFPKPLEGSDHPTREAFARESWIASRVHSPFVGQVLQVPPERQTQLYLALPFYDGETLESRLKRSPPISLATGLDIAVKLARGLAAVHRAGVIHRDIKPDNVIILPPAPPQGTGIKVVDFGVARLRQSPDPRGTAKPGTPSYMAPELFDGKPADEKSDQFALGVTVYRQFSGRFPYARSSRSAIRSSVRPPHYWHIGLTCQPGWTGSSPVPSPCLRMIVTRTCSNSCSNWNTGPIAHRLSWWNASRSITATRSCSGKSCRACWPSSYSPHSHCPE